jgi:ATP-dependent DNA helicase RecG
MMYDDTQLTEMLLELESETVERKESVSDEVRKKIRQAICAFANDLADTKKAGVIFIGARDDGSSSGLAITDQLLLTLGQMKDDGRILPIPTISVHKHHLNGADIAVVTVQPADMPPVRCDGEIWIRSGPRRARASAQDERILSEKRRHGDMPFEMQPLATSKLTDLSKARFEEEYLPNAFSADVLADNERSYEQRLASLRLISSVDDPMPTVLGMLVLGKRVRDFMPSCYIHFLKFNGTKLSDPIIDEAELDGSIADIARKLDEKIDAHNLQSVNYTNQNEEISSPQYPKVALQQLARNAILHRVYENTNSPIRFYWFQDRIELISPGGPYGLVNIENFGKPGVSDYRNRRLADAMHILGLVQRFGTGIALAKSALQKDQHPELKFDVDANFINATIWAKK